MQIPKSAFAVVFLKSNASEAQIFPFCQFLLEETFEKPFVTQNKSYPYDLILFPHIIEICPNYICENFNLNSTKFTSDYDSSYSFNQAAATQNTQRLVMCPKFLKNLTSHIQLSQSSTFLRFPYVNQSSNYEQDFPITYLLKSFSMSFQIDSVDNHASENLHQMKNDEPSKICCFKIPLKLVDKVKTVKRHSYALAFILRYDNDLMRFESACSKFFFCFSDETDWIQTQVHCCLSLKSIRFLIMATMETSGTCVSVFL
jgi:hypothetical protein